MLGDTLSFSQRVNLIYKRPDGLQSQYINWDSTIRRDCKLELRQSTQQLVSPKCPLRQIQHRDIRVHYVLPAARVAGEQDSERSKSANVEVLRVVC